MKKSGPSKRREDMKRFGDGDGMHFPYGCYKQLNNKYLLLATLLSPLPFTPSLSLWTIRYSYSYPAD